MKIVRNLLKTIAAIACILGFTSQMNDVFEKYFGEETYVTMTQEEFPELKMPLVTICVHHGMEKIGNFVKVEDYIKNSYSLNQIFLSNESDDSETRQFKKTPSLLFGMCYTMELTKPVNYMDANSIMTLNASMDYMVTIHEPGDEFWISLGLKPSDRTAIFIIDADNNDNIGYTELSLIKVCKLII